jgi:uncharacterized protein
MATTTLSHTEVREVKTVGGPARLHIDHARAPRRVFVLGHGAGGGVEASDLVAAAARLPGSGTTVVRFEQPWRVAGAAVAVAPQRLDAAWLDGLSQLPDPLAAIPLVVGGRSAGARVACRTAHTLSAAGVLTLAFPLHPPGRPEKSRIDELMAVRQPLRVVQGGADPFGTPPEFPAALDVVGIAGADHSFRVSRAGPLSSGESIECVVEAIVGWLAGMPTR